MIEDPTVLYRLYGADGLLYIGIARSIATRLGQHAASKDWFDQVTTIVLERFDTRERAAEAERSAIIEEKPSHNIVHNRGTRPSHIRTVRHAAANATDALVGKFVHTHGDPEHPREAGNQGRITSSVGDGYYLVMWHSWWDGAYMHEQLVHIGDMATWRFFGSLDDWVEAGDESSKLVSRRIEAEERAGRS